MNKTEAKHAAQDHLMGAMQAEVSRARDRDEPAEVVEAMEKQFRRAEKFFRYVEGSWPV